MDKKINWFQKGIFGKAWETIIELWGAPIIFAGERYGERGSRVDRAAVARTNASSSLVALPITEEKIQKGKSFVKDILDSEYGGNVMEPHKTMTFFGSDLVLPHGETRLSRKKWPKSASPVVVDIVYEGLVFTVAKATILLGKNSKKVLIEAEGISRLSPTDDPDNNNPIQGKEMAISQAIRALHVRVMKHRRSHHHYRG